jgi:hypothetical protein
MEPFDSNAVTVTFGRKWFFNGEFATLSNHYFVFARQVGIDLPKFVASTPNYRVVPYCRPRRYHYGIGTKVT